MKKYFAADKKSSTRSLLKLFMLGTCMGLAVLIVTLLLAIGRARGLNVGAGINAAIGSLTLVHIDKLAASDGGYIMTFSLKIGLLVIFASIYMLEAILFFGSRALHAKNSPQH
ncbi:MAG TPA: hypothetical protein VMR45_02735 [Patescibacteria group bacterium]|jgi:hypothetical protein|nr:hypothetical protein [Patescibacteria group bacterium]